MYPKQWLWAGLIGSAAIALLNAPAQAQIQEDGTLGTQRIDERNLLLNTRELKVLDRDISGQGRNITLNVGKLLLMRHNSQISITAGTAQAGAMVAVSPSMHPKDFSSQLHQKIMILLPMLTIESIAEAQGWMVEPDGGVTLVAAPPITLNQPVLEWSCP
jgi:hypothetical protein